MDPDKVDTVVNWKTPTNRDLLRGFIGSAGYLADDIYKVWVLLGVLSAITSDNVSFKWTETEQQAFNWVKQYVQACRNHCRVPIEYGENTKPVWFMTDACINGIAAMISQGDDWKRSAVAAFFSAKLNSAQKNYPVHEQEMLAGIEGMLHYHDILQGVRFTWLTDRKGLIHLYQQRNLSGRQAHWLEKISEFDFEIHYVPGEENVLPDALSRLYSNDAAGTVRAPSEYVQLAEQGMDDLLLGLVSMPVLVGPEAELFTVEPRRSACMAARVGDLSTPEALAPLSPHDRGGAPPPATLGVAQASGLARAPYIPDIVLPKPSEILPKPARRKVVAPAESGCPEMSAEFAKRMKDRFVLKGPCAPGE